MTPEEIRKLAEEYAEEVTKDMAKTLDESSCLLNETKRATKEYITDFMQWLLRTHCIVSKEKVRDEYETSKHYFEATDSSNPTQKQYFYGRMTVFESIFDTETFKNSEI